MPESRKAICTGPADSIRSWWGLEEETLTGKVDDTDRKLLMLIVTNPRISLNALSTKLGVTKQAVHHRLRALTDSGVIGDMTADISIPYLGAIPVGVFGISNAPSVPDVFDRLGECEFTRRVIAGCGNYLYVNGILRNISELDGFVNYVKRVARLTEVAVGRYSPDPKLTPNYVVDGIVNPRASYTKLSRLDLKIIVSLKKDVRRPAEEIAEELGVSAKTVRRHLDNMISDGSIELNVWTDSPVAGDLMFLVHVTVREGADRVAVAKRLMSRYPFKDEFFLSYTSIPNLLIWIFWTGDISQMRRIMSATDEDEDVVAMMPNLGYRMRIYPTWQDRLPEDLLQASEETARQSYPHWPVR